MIHNQCGVFVCALYVALSLYSQDPACPGHRLGGVREPWLRMRWCCLFKGGDITRPRKVVELWSWLFLLAVGSEFPPPWGCRPAYEYRRLVMAEGSELMNRLMSENADLKKQVRLLKENQMLKRLLSESCQDGGRGARDLLFPKTPPYPEACSPGSGGEHGPQQSDEPVMVGIGAVNGAGPVCLVSLGRSFFQVTVYTWGQNQQVYPSGLLSLAEGLPCFCVSTNPRTAAGQVPSHLCCPLTCHLPRQGTWLNLATRRAVSTPAECFAVASWEGGWEKWHCELTTQHGLPF